MVALRKARSWVPIHRGRIYCSPACGLGCTRAEYEKAFKDCADLCKLLGPGWEPEVWENLGWHYACNKGVLRLHPIIDRRNGNRLVSYMAYFNGSTQLVEQHEEAKSAVSAVVQAVKRHIGVMCRQLAEIEGP